MVLPYLLGLLMGLLRLFKGGLGRKRCGFLWFEGAVILVKCLSFQ